MPALDPNRYIPLVVEATAGFKILLRLGDEHVVFYVASAVNELRARAYGSSQVFTLANGVRHVHGFEWQGVAYIYMVMVTGEVQLLRYRYFGDPTGDIVPIATGRKIIYLHTVAQAGKFFMATDDGGKLYLLMASDPEFLQGTKTLRLYSNSLDPAYYVSTPTVGLHPDDQHTYPIPSRVTVGIERLTRSSGLKEVGFFVVEVTL